MEDFNNAQYCFQDRNTSCRKTSISTSIYITLYIFFSLISAFTVFLNLLVIISISHFKHLHTPTNLLILSLAVSDLLVGLIVIPAMTVAIMEPCWVLGRYFCALLLYINFLCCTSSLGNLILISIDRYVAVCAPLFYHSRITIIFVVARSQARKIFFKGAATLSGIKIVQASKSERKAAKTLGIVVFNYLLCWNPFLYIFCILFSSGNLTSVIITFLPLVNSFINPIIYALFYPWFKVTAKRILTLKLL
ncbi:trace amine-associated receptor 13c-like [Esox lucius]|uniref:trace amine-associated receptor 13c-like n=1 Tax=Esox lucius TaxID=8010 RepID=UPI0010BD5733|nr:trace amine-associated receptor 13c-like [Esox lucius]